VRLPSSRVLGLILAGAWVLHATTKFGGYLQELLWLCHVATALMVLGLLVGAHRVVAAGFLFHVGFGTMSWLLDILATHTTTPTSVLVHVLPLTAGAIELRRKGWPRGVVLPSWLFYTAWVLFSRWVTDPALNVNLSHQTWGPLAGMMGSVWVSGALNSAVMLGGFLLTHAVLQRLVDRPRSVEAPTAPG
jgi:hypothetical protein